MNELSGRGKSSKTNGQALDGQDLKLGFRSILAAIIGNMLEFYDFVTFSFFAIEIGHAFFHSRINTRALCSPWQRLALGL
ncbi:MAG: hypothetical protein WDN29_04310 [Methylovirgula sp.]